jgi:transcriptional regulator with XRE-family HTH domain
MAGDHRPPWAIAIHQERTKRRWSQLRLAYELERAARRLGYPCPTRRSLVRMIRGWESGEHKPSELSETLLAEAFKPVTPDWLTTDEDNPELTAEWQLLCGTLVAVLSSKGSGMERRAFLRQLLGVVAGTSLELTSDSERLEPWRRLERALDQENGVGASELSVVENGVRWLRRQYASVPSGRLLSLTERHLDAICALLRDPRSDKSLDALHALATQAATLAGWLSFDLHDHASAQHYYQVATVAAKKHPDPSLPAYVLGNISFLPTYKGIPHEAVAVLDEAQALANRGSSRTVRAWIAAVRAEALANTGTERVSLNALDQADEELAALTTHDMLGDVFDGSRLTGFRGVCLIQLGRQREAQQMLENALQGLAVGLDRQRANILTDLAIAFVRDREIEEGCRVGLQAIEVASSTRAAVGLQRIWQLRQRLQPWHDHEAVRQLDDRLLSL